MRGRRTGLLLTLILLVAAIPAVLACCVHGPDADARADAAPRPSAVHAVLILDPVSQAPSTRGCVDQAAPTQNPYIETPVGGGGGPAASGRSAEAAVDKDAVVASATAYSVRRSALGADGTGPPLWLSTCVSRT